MRIFSKIKNVNANNYINEINKSIENKNYLSALAIALINMYSELIMTVQRIRT